MKRELLARAVQPGHPLSYMGLNLWHFNFGHTLQHPTQLFFKGGYGEQFSLKHGFVIDQNMPTTVFNKTMNEMSRKVMNDRLLGAQEDKRLVEEQ